MLCLVPERTFFILLTETTLAIPQVQCITCLSYRILFSTLQMTCHHCRALLRATEHFPRSFPSLGFVPNWEIKQLFRMPLHFLMVIKKKLCALFHFSFREKETVVSDSASLGARSTAS